MKKFKVEIPPMFFHADDEEHAIEQFWDLLRLFPNAYVVVEEMENTDED